MDSGSSGCASSVSLIKVNGGGGIPPYSFGNLDSGLEVHYSGLSLSSILFTYPSFTEVFSLYRSYSSYGTDQLHYSPCVENIYCVPSLCYGGEGDFVCGLQMSF